MNIAIDARPLAPPLTGIGRYLHNTLDEIMQLPECNLHTWYLYSDQPIPVPFQQNNIKVRFPPFHIKKLGSITSQIFYTYWAIRDSIDVFWSPRHHLPLALPKSIKTVLTIHDLVWKYHPETMAPLGRLLESLLMPPSIKKANHIVTVSNSTKNDLLKEFHPSTSKLTTLYGAAFLPRTDNQVNSNSTNEKFYLAVGTVEPRKNYEKLIHAFSLAKNAGVSGKLVIVGKTGWGGIDLASLIDSLGMSNNIIVNGYVNDDELVELYSTCFALIIPSIYEGFGLPIVEAMQFGKPIIASDVSSMPEIAGDAALLVSPSSTKQIADAIVKLDSNTDLYNSLSNNAFSNANLYSWKNTGRKMMQLLSDNPL